MRRWKVCAESVTKHTAVPFISVPVTVVQLQLNASRFPNDSTPAAEVIRLLGMPDEKARHYISWPDSKFVDGVFYGPDVIPGGISSEHWNYKQYPGLAIAIVGGHVWSIGTFRAEN